MGHLKTFFGGRLTPYFECSTRLNFSHNLVDFSMVIMRNIVCASELDS